MSHQPTFLPNNIYMESSTTEGAPVAEGLPEETNAIGTQEKTTETEATHHWQQFTRAQFQAVDS